MKRRAMVLQPGASAALRGFTGGLGSVYLLFLTVLTRLFSDTPFVTVVPCSQMYSFTVGAFCRIFGKIFSVGGFTVGLKRDAGRLGGEAAG